LVRFVKQYPQTLVGPDGGHYVARVYAAMQSDALWDGWFVFVPLHHGRELATDRETTQNSLYAVSYWADGISTLYLHGALERARARLPEVQLARRAQYAEREEELARAEAAAHAEASAYARLQARQAEQRRREVEKLLMAERAVTARMEADFHKQAAAAARAEARDAERRRRHTERRDAARRNHRHRVTRPKAVREQVST
jgi:hypothetical protein